MCALVNRLTDWPPPRVASAGCVAELVRELMHAYDHRVPTNLTKLTADLARKRRLKAVPRLMDIIAAVPEDYRDKLLPFIKSKPVRTASGIAVVAVMCKPHRCPHIAMTGNVCVYCPGGPDSDFEYSTQAYTGYEPTSMRAIRARYHPYAQTRGRVDQLRRLGHSVDKVEFIVMGGTFMSLDEGYKDWFIRNLHDALSGHSSGSVAEAVAMMEQSRTKCIGITIETRPDYCLKPHLNEMLSYGCTRIEIGAWSWAVWKGMCRGVIVAVHSRARAVRLDSIHPFTHVLLQASRASTRTWRGTRTGAIPCTLFATASSSPRTAASRSWYVRRSSSVSQSLSQPASQSGVKRKGPLASWRQSPRARPIHASQQPPLSQTHMMPDLPNMGMERDLQGFREYFENPLFRSDGTHTAPRSNFIRQAPDTPPHSLDSPAHASTRPNQRRAQDLPDARDPRHGPVRAVEDGQVPKLHARRAGGPGGQDPGAGPALDARLPHPAVRAS